MKNVTIDNFIKVIVVKSTNGLNLEAGSVEGAYITIVNRSGHDLTITGNGATPLTISNGTSTVATLYEGVFTIGYLAGAVWN